MCFGCLCAAQRTDGLRNNPDIRSVVTVACKAASGCAESGSLPSTHLNHVTLHTSEIVVQLPSSVLLYRQHASFPSESSQGQQGKSELLEKLLAPPMKH